MSLIKFGTFVSLVLNVMSCQVTEVKDDDEILIKGVVESYWNPIKDPRSDNWDRYQAWEYFLKTEDSEYYRIDEWDKGGGSGHQVNLLSMVGDTIKIKGTIGLTYSDALDTTNPANDIWGHYFGIFNASGSPSRLSESKELQFKGYWTNAMCISLANECGIVCNEKTCIEVFTTESVFGTRIHGFEYGEELIEVKGKYDSIPGTSFSEYGSLYVNSNSLPEGISKKKYSGLVKQVINDNGDTCKYLPDSSLVPNSYLKEEMASITGWKVRNANRLQTKYARCPEFKKAIISEENN